MKIGKHRIIGIFLVALAIVILIMEQYATPLVVLMIFASILLFLAKKKYGEQVFDTFKKSFILDKKFSLVLLFDSIFWVATILVTILFGFIIRFIYDKTNIDIEGMAISAEVARENLHIMQSYFLESGLALLGYMAVMVLLCSLLTGLAWTQLANKKYSKKLFVKYLLFTLLNAVIYSLVVVAMFIVLKAEIIPGAFILFSLLYWHFLNVGYFNVAKKQKVRMAFQKMFKFGIRVHSFVIPYVFAFILYLLVIILFFIVNMIPNAVVAFVVQSILLFVAIIYYFTWIKVFITKIIEKW